MFKVGDEVICMNPDMNGYYNSTIYHIYYVDFVGPDHNFYGYDIKDKSSHRISTLLETKNFLLLSEYRRKKLEKICQNISKVNYHDT